MVDFGTLFYLMSAVGEKKFLLINWPFLYWHNKAICRNDDLFGCPVSAVSPASENSRRVLAQMVCLLETYTNSLLPVSRSGIICEWRHCMVRDVTVPAMFPSRSLSIQHPGLSVVSGVPPVIPASSRSSLCLCTADYVHAGECAQVIDF